MRHEHNIDSTSGTRQFFTLTWLPEMISNISGTVNGTLESRLVEIEALVDSTVSNSSTCTCFFFADIHLFAQRLPNLISMKKDPLHRSRRIGSNLFVRKLNACLNEM